MYHFSHVFSSVLEKSLIVDVAAISYSFEFLTIACFFIAQDCEAL